MHLIPTLLPPEPGELMNSVFCNCTKWLRSSCGCRILEIQYFLICCFWRGHFCINLASSDTTAKSSEVHDDGIDSIVTLSSDVIVDDNNHTENYDEDEENEENNN